MKKIIIITAILLFAISAHAQRSSKGRIPHEPERQKSETIVRRSDKQKQNSRSQQATTTRQASTRDISHARSNRTSSAKSQFGNPAGASRSQASKSTYEKPQRGQVYTNSTGPKGRTSGDRTPNRGNAGTFNGNKPSPNKGIAGRYNGYMSPNGNSHSNSQSVRGNEGEHRKHYTTPNRQAVRSNHVKGYHYNPVRYRNVNYHYRVPNRVHITWTNRMYHDYLMMYPEYRYWYYPIGYRIVTIPTYKAYYHIGEVRNVYGRVHEVYYSWTTDEYHLYFGGDFPYHDFTVIIPGNHARRFDRYPEIFFEGRYIWVTGLLSTFEGRPELIVKRQHQIHLY
jgi:hypothetical protein